MEGTPWARGAEDGDDVGKKPQGKGTDRDPRGTTGGGIQGREEMPGGGKDAN